MHAVNICTNVTSALYFRAAQVMDPPHKAYALLDSEGAEAHAHQRFFLNHCFSSQKGGGGASQISASIVVHHTSRTFRGGGGGGGGGGGRVLGVSVVNRELPFARHRLEPFFFSNVCMRNEKA